MALLSACATTSPAARTSGATTAQLIGRPPGSHAAGVCLDGTSSSARFYASRMRALVAAAIERWTGVVPAHPTAKVAARLGLSFVLRPVTTTSVSTDTHSVTGTIPGVPALASQPQAASDPNFDADIHAWASAEAGWHQAATSASDVAHGLADRISRFPVPRNTWSAIYGCIAAAAAQVARVSGPQTRIAVFSDMANNRPADQLRLRGASVLLVEICPAHLSASCAQRFAAARSYLLQHGASSVSVVRADAVTTAYLDNFWRGS